ncbi:hypothetical protein [Natrinema sp. HArc-T2]|uniref:DUF7344 domain-containing protein n=1 Tax=Natrinema sp. HArc-T2 TaxID=3242701 RepID=UPI00359E6382
MTSLPSTEQTTALDVLTEPRRRYLLATLLEYEAPSETDSQSASEGVSIGALATAVAGLEQDADAAVVTDEQSGRVRLTLVHAHVPRLVDAGLVTTHTDGDAMTVAPTDHPTLEAEWVRSILADPTGESFPADEATLNRTLEALRSSRRRTVCTALAKRRGTVPVSDLAATVAAREADDETGPVAVTESACTAVETSLAHEHLPTLSAAGLVEYDAAARTVALALDAPLWQADWVTEGPLAAVAEFVRHRAEQSGAVAAPHDSDRTTADATPADEPTAEVAPTETAPAPTTGSSATTDDRLLWTLARPPAGRSSSRSDRVPNTPSITEREER